MQFAVSVVSNAQLKKYKMMEFQFKQKQHQQRQLNVCFNIVTTKNANEDV